MTKQSPKIPPHLKTYRVRINHDCQGNDIQRGISLEGNDHRACEELCRGNDNCVGYTWHGRTSNWSECWLKNKMANCKSKKAGTCNKGSCITGLLNDYYYRVETNYGGYQILVQKVFGRDLSCHGICKELKEA